MTTQAPPLVELEVGAVAAGGGCVARLADGRVAFVRHSLPGERVLAALTSSGASFVRADALEVLRPSPDRVSPPCPHAGPGRCGGCDFQHVALPAQRHLKAALVAEQLRRVAHVEREVTVEAVPGDDGGLGWRTRVRVALDDGGRPGFRRHRSHQLELVTGCPIAHPGVLATGALATTWPGLVELEVLAPGSGDALIAARGPVGAAAEPPGSDVGVLVNGRVRRPPGTVHATVAGRRFRISAGVFWQVHVGAASALADVALANLGARAGDHVVDLYAGAGLFSVLAAEAVGPQGSVLAVERNARACADARHNSRHAPQVQVRRSTVNARLVAEGLGAPDLVVLDPAREGAGRAVTAALAALTPPPRRIVYVACDASSFSRDLRVLLEAGWELESLRAFDIFPMTEHVELVASLAPARSAAPS